MTLVYDTVVNISGALIACIAITAGEIQDVLKNIPENLDFHAAQRSAMQSVDETSNTNFEDSGL